MDGALTIEGYRPNPDNLPALRADTPVLIDPAQHFLPVSWELIERGAELVSTCPGLAPEFSDPKNCRFISYQAARWRMDPVAVASKTYFMPRKAKAQPLAKPGQPAPPPEPAGLIVGYEAQLVMALINSDPELEKGGLDFLYGYSGDRPLAGFRFCKAVGWLRGVKTARVVTSPTVSQIKVKNSPLWYSDPDQQLAYYTGRNWARRHRPGRLLGVYAREELEAFRDADTGVYEVRPLFEEEGLETPGIEGPSETVPPTEQDEKNYERWKAKASGEGDTRDPRQGGDMPADLSPDQGPPATGANVPADLEANRAWLEGERKRIVALTHGPSVADAANEVTKDKRFRRLTAYDQDTPKRFDQSIRNRIDELDS